ncbi:amidohydrolase [Cupriavidus taiwanensis]|uniref:amidohydrolase family protein n=1 Tax=Cupriavidus taiwanensis TaxID=164546 RepID=UPI000E14F4B2|nr:amidohydrolase [Cupriavidus taiwanensis]SOZ29554.1 5-methylthioadenosine/S-adenosylhomocysteine deaminase [Cupriavidus taiwanensis]SPA34389.1 5-methylthioadenosine/S-adenosylhomocysteine deaminase [Cupriavidus taiwanensis]
MPEQILRADHLLTMDAHNTVLTDGAVAVGADGRIAAVGGAGEIAARFPGVPVRRLANRLLMPGLVNTHCHSGLLRGTAEGLPVWQWLQQHIDPMHRVLSAEEAELASRLCYAEALLSGTTTVVDMWRHMAGSARAAAALGVRAVLVPYVAEHPEHDYFETLDSNEALIEQWHGGAQGRIQVWVGLEHMFYATPQAWRRCTEISQRHQVGFHTHSNESRFDVEETLRRHGMRPVQALQEFGLLDAPRVLLAHAVWLDDDEIGILARRRAGVAHNPVSNMKLASGAAPVERMRAAGIAVGLGTDGEKENNNLDMFEEMKTASLLAKLSTLDAAALDAWSVCRMATIDGARALGLDRETGSLEAGKHADLIAVRTDTPRMTPLLGGAAGNLHHNLVHAVQGSDVDLTMVAGRVVVDGGMLLSGELDEAIRAVNLAVPDLFERRARWLRDHPTVDALKA